MRLASTVRRASWVVVVRACLAAISACAGDATSAPAAPAPAASPAPAPSASPTPPVPPFVLKISEVKGGKSEPAGDVVRWESPIPVSDPSQSIEIRGHYEHEGWSLLTDSGTILHSSRNQDKDFSFTLEVRKEKHAFPLVEVGPEGQTRHFAFEAELDASRPDTLLYVARGDAPIPEIQLSSEEVAVRRPPPDKALERAPYVRIEGKFTQPGWKLKWRDQDVRIDPTSNSFAFEVPVHETLIPIRAVGPDKGRGTPSEEMHLLYRKPAAGETGPTGPTNRFSPSLGYAAITYSQTGRAAYSGTNVFVKFAWNHVFTNRSWDVDANAYFNALPISTNLTGINGRFLGVNARVGYAIPKLPDPWFARVALGVYYSSFYVTGDAFGYRNLIYPQIYPVVGYRSAGLGTIAGYLKYVPTNAGFVPNLTERELAGGLSLRRPAPGHPNQDMIFSVDYSNLIYLPLPSITVQTSAFALSVGLSF